MQSLVTHLRADAALDGVAINYGVTNPFPDQDFIDVRYGGSPELNLHAGDRGGDRLWLDVLKHLDKADAENAPQTGVDYDQLHALTNTALTSIRAWWTTAQVPNASLNAGVQEIRPDGEELRAHEKAGSRIILLINWIDTGA